MNKQFDILTIFPEFFSSPLQTSLLGKAIEKKIFSVRIHDIRKCTTDKHKTVDDLPYGGGPGMVMKPEPIAAAIKSVQEKGLHSHRVYFTPRGQPLRQGDLEKYLAYDQLILLCGRYEGVDQRVIDNYIDEEVSVGDYLLSGGEVAALVFLEALTRLIPGVLGNEGSLSDESFPLLEYPQYTRPEVFEGLPVPPVLRSGDHRKIADWRREQALEITQKRRPDLLKKSR